MAILFIVFEYQRYPVFLQFKNLLSSGVIPFHYLAESPVRLGRSISEKFVFQSTLLQENASLQSKNTLLEADLLRLAFLEKENAELQSLANADLFKARAFLKGRILAVDSTVYLAQVVVNQGSKQGVFIGQVVVDARGILGHVIQVMAEASRVQFITDTASGVPVQLLRDGVRGIAVGQGNQGRLAIKYVPITADVEVGDELVTSGLGGYFPAGYPVATVTSVQIQSGDIFLHIEAVPKANVTGANFVLFLDPGKNEIKK